MIETLQSIANPIQEFITSVRSVRSDAFWFVMVLGFVLFVRYAAARMGKE